MKHLVKGLVDLAKTHRDIADLHEGLADFHAKSGHPLSGALKTNHLNLSEAHSNHAAERHDRARHVAGASAAKGVEIEVGDSPIPGEKIEIPNGSPFARQDAEYIARMGNLHSKLAAVNAQIARAASEELGKEGHDATLNPLLRAAVEHHSSAAREDAEASRTYLREAREIAHRAL